MLPGRTPHKLLPSLILLLAVLTFLGAEAIGLPTVSASRLRQRGCRMEVRARDRQEQLFRLCGLTQLLAA